VNQSHHRALITRPFTRSLRLLLLVCSALLLLIIITLANGSLEQHLMVTAQATTPVEEFCGMTRQVLSEMPDALQNHLRAQCVVAAEPEIQ
jgi:hypothetical protein